MSIGERCVGHRAVLSVMGEVDVNTVADLRAAIDAAASRAFELWLDLSGTTFMDSSGVHALVTARAHLTAANRRLAVICPEGPALRVLELTGVDRVLEIHPTRNAAHHAATA